MSLSDNLWSNREKSIELFKKIIFPYLKQVIASLKCPKRTNVFDNHGHIQRTRQRCDS